MLSLAGYNYTNRYIASFSVNGQGGGNIFVSTPTSGGGGSACCVLYRPGNRVRKMTVRWQSDACYYQERSTSSGKPQDALHFFYREAEVNVDSKVPLDPKILEIHFYPDGTIRAEITEEITLPRLQLSNDREDKSDFPRCKNDKKPE